MSFSCPHFAVDRDACLRLKTDCVPGRPGCVLEGSGFAVPVAQRLREREEENQLRLRPGKNDSMVSPPPAE
ncbi:MAG: hypothetical protein DUW69_000684 [Verrucomicrobia bacterium]|jgi:hypothetical protein|nr:MAG: hypothetical protein DUW69_000684 [Verrucomicrobiota bacterium]